MFFFLLLLLLFVCFLFVCCCFFVVVFCFVLLFFGIFLCKSQIKHGGIMSCILLSLSRLYIMISN